jgi:tetratricopeptide (TPR) repeat protein
VLGDVRLSGVRRWLAPSLAIVVGAALAADTVGELRWWHDTRTLFEHALQVTDGNTRAMVMVGSFRAEDGKIDEAMELYRQALSYRDDPEAHFFLGHALEQRGNLVGAAGEYSQALWFRPLQERTHIALGLIRAKQGQTEQAAAHYRAALASNPESAPAENNLARLLHSEGKLDEAIAHYSNAVRFDPNLAQAHNNLGALLLQKGKLEEGMAQLREALRLNPGDAETQFNLASALNEKNQWNEAAELLAKVTPARPQDANAQYQYALALAHLGHTRDAMSQYAKALLLRPDFPEALDGLAWILATDPHSEFRNGPQALQMSTLACDLTARKQPAMLATLAAAQAEISQFTEAAATVLKAQQRAEEMGSADQAAKCKAMGEAFSAGRAWREDSRSSAK